MEGKLEDIIQTFKDIVYKYCDRNLINIESDDYFHYYVIKVNEKITNFNIFSLKVEYIQGTKQIEYMNFTDYEFNEIQHKANFESIEKYIKNYYNGQFYYSDILNIKNFNTELYNQTIINYFEKTNDVSLFKDENFNKRLTTELRTKYDYLINANKFDLI